LLEVDGLASPGVAGTDGYAPRRLRGLVFHWRVFNTARGLRATRVRRSPRVAVERHDEEKNGLIHEGCDEQAANMEATVRKRGITIPLNAGYAESNPRISRGSDGRVGRASRGRYSALLGDRLYSP
jgi:hypothetical protein